MAKFSDVLKERNFFCLWLGQIISNFGDRLNQMALIGFVSQKAPRSTYELAKLMLFVIIPVFVIGPVAGAYVDRWNRKHTMIISDILSGILALLIPFFILNFRSSLPVYVIVFLMFSMTRFFLPSKMAIIPSIVSKEKLLIANSLSDTTYMIATVLSIGLAGLLIKWAGVLGGFYINAVSFFISAAMLSLIRLKKCHVGATYREEFKLVGKAVESAVRRPKSVWHEVRDGIAFIMTYPNAKFVMNTLFLLMAGAGAVFCVIIVFIQDKFGTLTSSLGFLGMFTGAGLLLGALIYGRLGHGLDKKKVISASFILGGLGIASFALIVSHVPKYRIAGLLCVFIGLVLSPIITSINTLIHETIPDEKRGRIFSSQEIVIHLAFLLFMFLTSILAEYIDRMWILTGCGVIFSGVGLVG
ncbi:MAG: MFS transporter, partial [Candidatus Omnitrophica bacterium]|nr:MFS transporter [Candidatus Omnitrophota bacterium]